MTYPEIRKKQLGFQPKRAPVEGVDLGKLPGLKAKLMCKCPQCEAVFPVIIIIEAAKLSILAPYFDKKGATKFEA